MKNLNIPLSDEIGKFVQSQATEGGYPDAAAYIRALIEADRERQVNHVGPISQLREKVAIGVEQLERGEYSQYTDETLNELLEETETLGKAMFGKRRASGKK